jgi:hypothetical protein
MWVRTSRGILRRLEFHQDGIPDGMVDAQWLEEWCALSAAPAFLKQQE